MGHRLADGCSTPSLAGSKVSSFEPQCVVFVFGNVLFVSRRFVGHPHRLLGLQQILGEPIQYLLLQQKLIHDAR